MIIQSIRLKHIKSYGAGPDGDGVTVSFEKGVNRVAGRNGHGKTTLIESIGYALFLTKPQFAENFQTETYFLSHGAKEGEIDVTLSCEGQSYRIERAVGKQTKRRSKVVQVSDQSICAEGDTEVSDFLCRLLKFPDPGHLSEVFRKLVGVKQGRLALPFDSAAADAKRYFEPLLEVDVFRDCFNHLIETVRVFKGQREEHNEKQAKLTGQIEALADSPEKLAGGRKEIEETNTALDSALKDRDVARVAKDSLEALDKTVANARNTFAKAAEKSKHAQELCSAATRQVAESEAAVKVLAENQTAHEAHVEAEELLGKLEKHRVNRDELKEKRDETERGRVDSRNRADAAREQAKEFERQRSGKQKQHDTLTAKILPAKKKLDSTGAAFEKSAGDAKTAATHRDAVGGWGGGVGRLKKGQAKISVDVARFSKAIAGWDDLKLAAAGKAENDARRELESLQKKFAKAEQSHLTLGAQLKEISGGICPFLKEKCRQFDPAKVRTDLEVQSSAVAILKEEVEKSGAAHEKAKKTLDSVKEVQANIKGQETELAASLGSYREGMEAIFPDDVAGALKWLGAWDHNLPVVPSTPKLPSGELNAAGVAELQERLNLFAEEVDAWWKKADAVIKARLESFQEEKEARSVLEANLIKDLKKAEELQEECESLLKSAKGKEAEASKHDGTAKVSAVQISNLDEALKPFADLTSDIKREQGKREANRIGHERYLVAKKTAEDLAARKNQMNRLEADARAAQTDLEAAGVAVKKFEKGFDPEQLKTAQQNYEAKNERAIALKEKLKNETSSLKHEEGRFSEWKKACEDRGRVAVDIGRCEAALELVELARKTLAAAAPAVAQHLCNRIAIKAQGVFNQINPDPIELSWDANGYSLRVTPGERHFAMLSGGEQTKLALAMTLAMIEEFSGLRFCIFDEPTYGVDADSRQKLADAILQAQKAAGLDQLMLVSHDDAFEGKIEHAILLEKSAATGTRVSAAQ